MRRRAGRLVRQPNVDGLGQPGDARPSSGIESAVVRSTSMRSAPGCSSASDAARLSDSLARSRWRRSDCGEIRMATAVTSIRSVISARACSAATVSPKPLRRASNSSTCSSNHLLRPATVEVSPTGTGPPTRPGARDRCPGSASDQWDIRPRHPRRRSRTGRSVRACSPVRRYSPISAVRSY